MILQWVKHFLCDRMKQEINKIPGDNCNFSMKKYLPALLIILLFIASSFFSQQYNELVVDFASKNKITGTLIYFGAIIAAVTIAPLTSIPLIPILTEAWGVLWTTMISVIGWTAGSMLAFWIARKFGAPIVKRFVAVEKYEKAYKNIPEERLFLYLIFLRIITPVDLLSYALGLFTNINWRMFILSTFFGVIPATFILSYFGTFPAKNQFIIFLIGIILLAIILSVRKLLRRLGAQY